MGNTLPLRNKASTATLATALAATSAPAPKTERLFDTLRPSHYDVHLTVDPAQPGFSGTVRIEAELLERTGRIPLHAAGLKIFSASVNGKAVDASRIVLDEDEACQTATLVLGQPAPKGKVSLSLEYSGSFNPHLEGLYRAPDDHGGKRDWAAFTQFEATEFRKAVPGVDEPLAKATFDLTVTAPEDKTVLSNMPARSRKVEQGRQTVRFARTPRMSTYLLALSVGRFASKSTRLGKLKISIWAPPEKLDQVDFALRKAKRAIDYFQRKTGVPYPLPKQDLLLVAEFRSGAMENWGLITFRDSRLLVHPKLSSSEARKGVSMVVGHENAHMWWGDLVTMDWWDGLFLNESNADLMGYDFAAQDEPKWNYWLDYRRDTFAALGIDGLKSGTHKILVPVNSPSEIDAIFDVLTYEKGGSLLRMIQTYMTPELYWKGIRTYLRAHKYGNAAPRDFWSALEGATRGKVPVVKIARDWFEQEGYPIVTVEQAGDGRVRLAQRRFFYDPELQDETQWTVPMILRYGRGGKVHEQRALLSGRETTVSLEGKGPLEWLWPNSGETGYYRTELAGDLSAKVLDHLNRLKTIEKMGLLNNLWARARAGGELRPLLDALARLRGETDRFLIEETAGYLREIGDRLVSGEAQRRAFEGFVERQFGPLWDRLGWPKRGGEEDDVQLARAAVLAVLGPQRPEIAREARERLSKYFKAPESLPPALVPAALRVVTGGDGSETMFERLAGALKDYKTPEQKHTYLSAGFSEFKDSRLIRRFLDMSLAKDERGADLISKQDVFIAVGSMLRSAAAQEEAWSWVRERFPRLKEKMGPRPSTRVIGAAGSLWRAGASREIQEFFTRPENYVESGKYVLAQSVELSAIGARFRERQREGLAEALSR